MNGMEDDHSLAEIVKKKKSTNEELTEILTQKNVPLWIPSLGSFGAIFGIVLFFGILSHPDLQLIILRYLLLFDGIFGYLSYYQNIIWFLKDIINIPLVDTNHNHYQNFIAIHAGIGAVLVGLAFFVAQSLVDQSDPDKGRVLLYKSYFFPLLTAEILIFLIFIWGDVNIFILVPISILALFTIYFLGGTINILIKDHKMEEAKKEMFFYILKRNFIHILDKEVQKGIGNDIWSKKCEEIKIKTNGLVKFVPYGGGDSLKYISITADKSGSVTDISFKYLEELITEIQNIENNNNPIDYKVDTPDITDNNNTINNNKTETKVYIYPEFLGHHSETPNELIKIREDLFDKKSKEEDLQKLKEIVSRVFTIQKLPKIEEEPLLEISKIKDRCLRSIKNEETGELKKTLDFYIHIVRWGYSLNEILKPMDWILWLSKDIREIFEKGIQSNDIYVVKEVAYLPIRLASEAIEYKDHLMFQEFIEFPKSLYSSAYDKKDNYEKISKFMFDRTWRYLKELSDYHLESKLRKNEYDTENFTSFAVYILKVFQGLIKASLDKGDVENFKKFLKKAAALFKNLSRQYSYNNEGDPTFDKINKKRQEMLFGIASWALFIAESHKEDSKIKEYKEYFEICRKYLSSDIEELTTIFLNVHDWDVEESWGWSNWEMEEESEDGELISITILQKLEKLYAIQSLHILQSKNKQEINKIELPYTRELVFLAEGSRDLLKILDDIKDNPKNWTFVLNNKEISKVDKFRALLQKAKEDQEKVDLQRKRETDVSEKKIEEFKKNVVNNFYESYGIRHILKYYELFTDKSAQPYKGKKGKIERFGINTMLNKAPFFDKTVEWHVAFPQFDNGFDAGSSLINGENNKIIKIIQEQLNSIGKEELDSELENYDLKSILIISLNGASQKFFEGERIERYKPSWKLDEKDKNKYPNELVGKYIVQDKEIPVYEIYDKSTLEEIWILDKKNWGQIIQYSPLDKDESKELQEDIFYMDVGIFKDSSDLMRKFLDNPPAWLKKVGDQDAQKGYLKEKVVIKIVERFEFQLAEEVRGFKIIR